MEKLKFRHPTAEEVEARIGTINGNGLTLLIYQQSRTAMSMLDETVGPERWQRSHELINGNLYCNIGIYFEGIGFVYKQDVGVESNQDKEKGQASDAFKRAAVNWGICRELYTAPFVWVPANLCNICTGKNGKLACYDRFNVKEIGFDENDKMDVLTIVNETTRQTVFNMNTRKAAKAQQEANKGKMPAQANNVPPQEEQPANDAVLGEKVINAEARRKPRPITDKQKAIIYQLCSEIGQDVGKVLTAYKVANINGLTSDNAEEIIGKLDDYRKKK